MGHLTIGQLAQRVGVNVETIRYYEREGLMPLATRTPGRRRFYGAEAEKRLSFIRRARELDFSLEDIRALLAIHDTGGACRDAQTIAERNLERIGSKIRKALEAEKMLKVAISQCSGGDTRACTVIAMLQD